MCSSEFIHKIRFQCVCMCVCVCVCFVCARAYGCQFVCIRVFNSCQRILRSLQRVALLCLSRAKSKKLRWIPVEAHHLVRSSAFSLFYDFTIRICRKNAEKGNKFLLSLSHSLSARGFEILGAFFGTSCLVLVVVIEFAMILKTVRICGRQARARARLP